MIFANWFPVRALLPADGMTAGYGSSYPVSVWSLSFDEACAEIEFLEGLTDAKPDGVNTMDRMAQLYHRLDEWDQAIAYYTLCFAMTEDDDWVYSFAEGRGACYYSLRRFEEALEDFAVADRLLDPSQEEADRVLYYQRKIRNSTLSGYANEELGRMEEAKAKYAECVQAYEASRDIRHERQYLDYVDWCYERLSLPDGAIELNRRIAELLED